MTRVGDANDLEMLQRALDVARNTHDRPTMIIVDSHIAYGSPNKQDTSAGHGEPLGEDEIKLVKRNYGWPEDAKFLVPDGVCANFDAGIGKRGKDASEAWEKQLAAYKAKYAGLADEIVKMQHRENPDGWDKEIPVFPAESERSVGPRCIAARSSTPSRRIIRGCSAARPTWRRRPRRASPSKARATSPRKIARGRNFHFGIREHAMGSSSTAWRFPSCVPTAVDF